jgi:hypothetical protein
MDDSLHIRPLSLEDAPQLRLWDAYVLRHPQATFFHRAGWARVVAKVWGHRCHLLAAWRGDRLAGLLPLGEIDSWLFGHSLSSLPFAVYGGLLADDETVAKALEQYALSLASSLSVEHLELRYLQPRHPEWPRQDLYVTFRKELFADDEQNLLAIPRKQRAMVRKGIGNGLRAEVDADAGRFFALSSVLSFYFRDEVLPYYAGDAVAARELAANDFKYWALMQHAWRRGARLFDYGRSKIGTGPYSFKKNWGFTPQPLSYEFQLLAAQELPQHNPNNPKYQLMIRAWRRLPLWLVNRIGPPIVRNLG